VGRRVTIVLLFLVLLAAPVGNLWCATVCEAMAISSGCGHDLQPSDNLPMAKAEPAPAVVTVFAALWHAPLERSVSPVFVPALQLTPLRL